MADACFACSRLAIACAIAGLRPSLDMTPRELTVRARPCAGISQYDAAGPPRYASRTDLSSRVGGLNPRWNQPASDADLDARFQRAVAMTGAEFLESVDYISQVRCRVSYGHRCKYNTHCNRRS